MKRLLVLPVAVALVAAACGSNGNAGVTTTEPPTGGTTPTAPPTTSVPTTLPGDPDRLLLQITDEGGFAPIEFLINRVPGYSLYADGTLLAPGPVPAIFPGPILAPVVRVQLSEDDLEDVMTLVDAIGLPDIDREIDDTLNSRVADATTTIATYFDPDGGEHVYGAYALGLVMDEPVADATLNLGALRSLLDGFVGEGGGGELYEPERLQLYLNDTPFADTELSETLPWPLSVFPDDFELAGDFDRPCHVLVGSVAQQATAAFGDANQATLWDFEGVEYQILARHLLPGEPGCIP